MAEVVAGGDIEAMNFDCGSHRVRSCAIAELLLLYPFRRLAAQGLRRRNIHQHAIESDRAVFFCKASVAKAGRGQLGPGQDEHAAGHKS